jgi:anhydro-N-acetylmuramic acid kinase
MPTGAAVSACSRKRTGNERRFSGFLAKRCCIPPPPAPHLADPGEQGTLARATGIAVVNEFRAADVAAGGQGAPFVPLYHLVLTRKMERPIAVVNIGGVSNLTYVGVGGELIAFDTGPGNAALDDWALAHTGAPVDSDGKLAGQGRVNETVLASMLHHPMFLQPPPKSLDRFDFPMAA